MADSSEPPTPDGLPVLGNGLAFSRDPVRAMESWADLGDVVRIRVPGGSLYQVTDPGLIERILVTDQESFTIGPAQRETFEGVEDDAVTIATGERWKRLRRALHPAFTRERLDAYADDMAATAASVVDDWPAGGRLDLHAATRRLTATVLADSLLDVDLRGDESVVMDAADALVDRASFDRPGAILPDWIPTFTDRRFRRSVATLDDYVDDVIADRRRDGTGDDVCSVLLDAHDRGDLSMAEVRDNLVALLLAGHESPAAGLTYAWWQVSEHPDVHDALREEYDAVVDGDRPAGEDYQSLSFHRDVVAEALRLYPPTAGVNRVATEPVHLGGYAFESGDEFLLPQWPVHRDERWWDDPETFAPWRWQGETDRPDYAYFPFSGGPRLCIGDDFARQELTLALATMVGRLEPDVDAETPLSFTPSVALRPSSAIEAVVSRRSS